MLKGHLRKGGDTCCVVLVVTLPTPPSISGVAASRESKWVGLLVAISLPEWQSRKVDPPIFVGAPGLRLGCSGLLPSIRSADDTFLPLPLCRIRVSNDVQLAENRA